MRLSCLLLAACLAAPAAYAQDEKPEAKKDDQPEKKTDDAPPQPRGGGGRRQWGGLPVDQLKEKLGLTDDQVKKLEEINEESRQTFRKDMQELSKDGGFDYQKMRDLMPKRMAEVREKVKEILTDEQKPKFEEWAKEAEAQMRRGGPGRDRGPEAMKKRLLDQAEKELQLTPDEKAAVLPLVKKVLDARADARTNGDKRKEEFTQFVKKAMGADDAGKAEIQKKLDEFRKAREADQQRVKDAESALRDVLTIDNEAKLVALGILE